MVDMICFYLHFSMWFHIFQFSFQKTAVGRRSCWPQVRCLRRSREVLLQLWSKHRLVPLAAWRLSSAHDKTEDKTRKPKALRLKENPWGMHEKIVMAGCDGCLLTWWFRTAALLRKGKPRASPGSVTLLWPTSETELKDEESLDRWGFKDGVSDFLLWFTFVFQCFISIHTDSFWFMNNLQDVLRSHIVGLNRTCISSCQLLRRTQNSLLSMSMDGRLRRSLLNGTKRWVDSRYFVFYNLHSKNFLFWICFLQFVQVHVIRW